MSGLESLEINYHRICKKKIVDFVLEKGPGKFPK